MAIKRHDTPGTNSRGMRAHNERLILTLLHQEVEGIPGSELARRTGLSSQTASVILRKMEADALLRRGQALKGRVGKPSIPMQINPNGAFAYGLKIGRRSADFVWMDFTGNLRHQSSFSYTYPRPADVFEFVAREMSEIENGLSEDEIQRVCGLGIGVPHDLWSWSRQIGASETELAAWREMDFHAEIAAFCEHDVFVLNDATAACRAEHILGQGKGYQDYAYFYVGSFVGGGVVLNHSVYEGRRGNAGAMGPMPVCGPTGAHRLHDQASLHVLKTALETDGQDSQILWEHPLDWDAIEPQLRQWIEESAEALAEACLSACAVIDFEAIVIDGAVPDGVRCSLAAQVEQKLSALDHRGLLLPRVVAGSMGPMARVMGAACTPFFRKFLLNTNEASAF